MHKRHLLVAAFAPTAALAAGLLVPAAAAAPPVPAFHVAACSEAADWNISAADMTLTAQEHRTLWTTPGASIGVDALNYSLSTGERCELVLLTSEGGEAYQYQYGASYTGTSEMTVEGFAPFLDTVTWHGSGGVLGGQKGVFDPEWKPSNVHIVDAEVLLPTDEGIVPAEVSGEYAKYAGKAYTEVRNPGEWMVDVAVQAKATKSEPASATTIKIAQNNLDAAVTAATTKHAKVVKSAKAALAKATQQAKRVKKVRARKAAVKKANAAYATAVTRAGKAKAKAVKEATAIYNKAIQGRVTNIWTEVQTVSASGVVPTA